MSILDRFKKQGEQPMEETATSKAKKSEGKTAKKPAAKKAKATETKKTVKGMTKQTAEVLLRPVISEKTARLSEASVIAFEVRKSATRIEVQKAFAAVYGVRPVRVNIINVRGAAVRFGRTMGRQSNVKKAMIFLPKGSKVDIFEGV